MKTNYVRTLNIDDHLTRITGSTIRHYVKDALGSVMALVDDSGATKTTYVYDAFGNITTTGETSDNPFQYTGRENDETGLYYYRARYFSPEMQRFISEDPIRLRGGINFYSYVQNNPVNYIDPSGKSWIPAIIAGGAAAGGWYLYNHNETFRGVVDAVVGIFDNGPVAIGSAIINVDFDRARVLPQIENFNAQNYDNPENQIDKSWAYDHIYEAEKLLKQKKMGCQ